MSIVISKTKKINMNKILTFFFITLLAPLTLFGQTPQVVCYDPPIPYVGNIGEWGTDYVVSPTEPFGRPSGVVRPNDTLYVAIPDTNILANTCLVILKSSNNGANWSIAISISTNNIVAKTRMVRSGLDSIYCMFRFGGGALENQVYILKVNLPLIASSLRPFFSGGYRDFDCWASSTGGFYVFADTLGTNSLPRYASTNGGVSWSQRGVVTSAAAHPFCYKSGTGDTAILMYYQIPTSVTDTTTSGITIARYRESANGTLSSIAFLTNIIPAGAQKDQFGAGFYSGVSLVLYTTGAPGSRDIMFIASTNSGVNYTSPLPLANSPNADEYYFDIEHFTFGSGGGDIVYIYDSSGTKDLMYTSGSISTPGVFTPPESISEHAPQSSVRNYIPFLMEFYDAAGDVGAVWVGLDGSNRRVYFDRLEAITGLKNIGNTPAVYSLSQNYPNPFNPSTKIDFVIPEAGFVIIKVYDILGREVASLINKEMKTGSYTVDFDASALSTGVYFYKLSSGSFTDTKKMILVK
jgi:hypothetical protein